MIYKLKNYGLKKEEYEKCLPYITEKNHTMCGIILKVIGIITSILFFVSLFMTKLQDLRFVYLFYSILMIICSILNKKLRFKDSIEVYVVMILCLSLGCALILPYPSEKSTIFPLLIVILPTLFTEKFHNMVIFLISAITLFLGLVLFHQDNLVLGNL